ncbi:MAG: arsenate reductase ArsC [Bacteroidota bacterium]
MRILVLCTGNSCRSQMAEGFLKYFKPEWEVFSAGIDPAAAVSRRAIRVMQEIGIDISRNKPKHIDQFLSQSFDYVVTVCDHANETCPVFTGKVKNRIHIGFPDPTKMAGEPEEVIREFRRVRDDMNKQFKEFIKSVV